MDDIKVITVRNHTHTHTPHPPHSPFSFQVSKEYIRVMLKAFHVAWVDVSYQFTVKSRAMPLGKTLSNYYLWSCICSWYKMQDWFLMPPPEQGEDALNKIPFCFLYYVCCGERDGWERVQVRANSYILV